ncbi:MAG TPA: DUF6178 family protein [Geobacteraceae bacterium]|nr:DUF6178 family protein [Geobacteraceae bacterium]
MSEKIAHLRAAAGNSEKIAMILSEPEGVQIVRSLESQEIYWLIKEQGEADAVTFIRFSSPEQFRFFLDAELWKGSTYSRGKGLEWIAHLLKAGEERVLEQLPRIDFELLVLICKKELVVGGGIGDMLSDEERAADWDHTFDNIFYLGYRDEKSGPLMNRFLDIVFRHDQALYLSLMEGIKNEIESEQEELCYRFRSGRLADLGFPERDHALEIYQPLDPDAFVPDSNKDPVVVDFGAYLPVPVLEGNSLLWRAMNLAGSGELHAELLCLVNSALVAEDDGFADSDSMQSAMQRVYGYLNIALEHLCEGDEKKAARMLETEYLKRLFQLAFGIVSRLRSRAMRLAYEGSDHAINRALLGFRNFRPRFYRGLDPDHVDGYREFSSLDDVRAVEALLCELER